MAEDFHNFSKRYSFEKPNDRRSLDLMNDAAKAVMAEIPDIIVAYGISDEYSFIFHKSCVLFDRRLSKLLSTVVSTFTAHYIHHWPSFFGDIQLSPPLPTFDGRIVQYPSEKNLRDYLSWRQVDCHINNLYNTTFWALIQLGGLDAKSAEKELAGTLASDKHEILFSRFKINYNKEPEIYKKGSVIIYDHELDESTPTNDVSKDSDQKDKHKAPKHEKISRKKRGKLKITVQHLDVIKDDFWEKRPWILGSNMDVLSSEYVT